MAGYSAGGGTSGMKLGRPPMGGMRQMGQNIQMVPASIPSQGPVVDPADVARREALAAELQERSAGIQPIEHWTQGAAQLANALAGGLIGRKAAKEKTGNNKILAEALGDFTQGELSPDRLDQIMALNPELGMQLYQSQQERADALDQRAWEREKLTAGQTKPNDVWRPLTANEAAAYGLDPKGGYQINGNNEVKQIGGNGTTVNIDGGSGALMKKLGEKTGELWSTYDQAATVAGSMGQDFQLLDELIKVAPQGPIEGRLAQAFPGVSTAGDAFQSIVKRVAPSLRVPGSGSTSDIEYEGMLQSLPSLANQPAANAMIASMMKAKAQINMERGQIVSRFATGAIDETTARQQMADLNQRSIMTPEMQQALAGITGDQTGQPAATAVPGAPPVGTIEDGYRFKGGNPQNPANWEPAS